MARARNLKPGFFKNEDLAECDYPARLLFSGLWTLADREGRLENRPKRIKGEIFPFDTIDVAPLLDELEKWDFIVRYQVAGVSIIQIVNFTKHQQPHGTEKDSELPDQVGMLTVHTRGKNGYATGEFVLEPYVATVKSGNADGAASGVLTVKGQEQQQAEAGAPTVKEQGDNTLNPESLLLNPESLHPPAPKGVRRRAAKQPAEEPPGFTRFWTVWPPGKRKEGRSKCAAVWVRDGLEAHADTILAHVEGKLRHTDWAHDNGNYVEGPIVYLNGQKWDGAELPGSARASTSVLFPGAI